MEKKKKAKPKQLRAWKGWALCHRGTPLKVYLQSTRKQVEAECCPWNTVMRVEVQAVIQSKP
jgi:hypothetical protein